MNEKLEILEDKFSKVESELYRLGYETKYSIDGDDISVAVSKNKEKFMPDLEVICYQDEDGGYSFGVNVDFPSLKTEDSDLKYNDSVHHWIQKWEEVGEVVKSILNIYLNYNEEEE